ncbi:ionotropic receptor 75a-like [Wyeomyia smithii]|uniref:ionotropic receptor 75a-like n=1 Tax=Wyeomyia smithii TaxID=174621 RepID=UPI002467F1F7|nr:ionotropic receptor 75a-like [Wyeomyia smithii]
MQKPHQKVPFLLVLLWLSGLNQRLPSTMSPSINVACILLSLGFTANALINPQLAQEFFTQRSLKSITVFHYADDGKAIRTVVDYLVDHYHGSIRIIDLQQSNQRLNYDEIMRSYPISLGVTIDVNCQQTSDFFGIMSAHNFFNGSYEWLLFGEISNLRHLLSQENLNIDSRVTLAIQSGQSYELFDVYNIFPSRGGKFHMNSIGHWDALEGFNLTWIASEYTRRSDFEGVTIRAIFTDLKAKHNETILQRLDCNKPITSYAFYRFGHKYINMVKQKHNFKIQHIHVPTWGVESIKQRTSVGVIGQLKDKYVDLASNVFYIYQDRIPYIDNSVIVAKHEHPKRAVGQIVFLEPFDANLWYALLATGIFSSVLLGIAFRLERKILRAKAYANEYFLTILGFICQQAFEGQTSTLTTRAIAFIVLLFSSLMYQFYGAFIIGSLLTPPPKNLKTVRQLIDSNIHVTMENLFYHWDFFNRTKDPAAIELFKKKILESPEKPTNITHGVALIRKGGYAFHCDVGYAYPILKSTLRDDEICDLQAISMTHSSPLHVPLAKGSPLKQYFRVTMRKLVESGSGGYYNREYFSSKPSCPKRDFVTEPIDVKQVVSIFYILALGLMVSLAVLMIEKIHYRYRSGSEVWEFIN